MKKTIESLTYDFGGDVFIDVGGNVGMWTGQLVDLYKKIYFIEPSMIAIKTAESRIKNPNVTFLKYACTDKIKDAVSITSSTTDSGNFSIFAKELYGEGSVKLSEDAIPTMTLDSLIDQVEQGKIFIKIDTEGCDLDVVLGGFEFIKKFKPTIFIEAHYHMFFDQLKHDTVFDFLKQQGYTITEFKNPNYLNLGSQIIDHKHTGKQMYDLHFQMICEII